MALQPHNGPLNDIQLLVAARVLNLTATPQPYLVHVCSSPKSELSSNLSLLCPCLAPLEGQEGWQSSCPQWRDPIGMHTNGYQLIVFIYEGKEVSTTSSLCP